MKAHVPVAVAAATSEPDGRYHLWASDAIEMESDHGRSDAALRSAESVLRIAEEFIRRVPQQWAVPLPVWPYALDLVPA